MSELLDWVEGVGRAVPAWVVRANVEALVLLAGVVIADVLLARRVSAAWRMMLYLLVPLRVLVPFAWPGAMAMVGGGVGRMSGTWTFVGGRVEGGATGVMGMTSGGAAEVGSQGGAWGVWVAGAMVAVVGVLVWSWWRCAERLAREIREGSVGERVREGVLIVEHSRLGPLVAGVLKPRVVVPEGLVRSVGEARAEWVERHEIRHVKRGDPVVAFGVRALCVLCWPVVAIWLAAARVRTLMEQACDEATVAGGDACGYGEALLVVSARAGGVSGGTSLAFGAGVRGRIAALAKRRRWSGVGQALAVLGAGLLLAACAGEGSRQSEEQVTVVDSKVEYQAEGETSEAYEVEFRIFKSAPVGSGFDTESAASASLLVEEAEALATLASARPESAMLSAPKLIVREGQWAEIAVGDDRDRMSLRTRVGGDGGAGEVRMTYAEMEGGRTTLEEESAHRWSKDRVLVYRVHGKAGRLIMVRVHEHRDAAASEAKFLTMVNLMSVRGVLFPGSEPLDAAAGSGARRLLVVKDEAGAYVVGGAYGEHPRRAKSAWAVVASDAAVLRMMDILREHAGGSVTAVPAVVTWSGQEAEIGMDAIDKAHQRVGRAMRVRCDASAEGVQLRFEGRSGATVRAEGLAMERGESLMVFVVSDSGAHEVYAVRPALLGGDKQVYQTSEVLGESPRGR